MAAQGLLRVVTRVVNQLYIVASTLYQTNWTFFIRYAGSF